MQATAGAAAVTWTGSLCCRRCAERVPNKGDPRRGTAVHAATGKETCADGRLIAPTDACIVKAAAAALAGDES